MPLTNLLKPQVDLPVFEWLRFSPSASAAATALSTSEDNTGRYLYYVVGNTLVSTIYKYDTYSDSWQTATNLATGSLTTGIAAKYTKYNGYRGDVISATSTTLTLAGLKSSQLLGQTIRIISGTGAGQERVITSVADPVIWDSGTVTTAGTASFSDVNKKWKVNQWDAYQVRFTMNQGIQNTRKILYNGASTLFVQDDNFQSIDPFNNTAFNNFNDPYRGPTTTAGAQTHYSIESTTVTVNTSWTVTPDGSSRFVIMTGGMWILGSNLFWFYDPISDIALVKTPLSSVRAGTSLTTSWSLERIGEVGGSTIAGQTYGTFFVTGITANAGGTYKAVGYSAPSGTTYTTDRYANYQLRVVSGTGVGQKRRIVGNQGSTFYIEKNWDIVPDATSGLAISGDTEKLWLYGSASSAMFQYHTEADMWAPGHVVDWGICRNISATSSSGNTSAYGPPHEGFAVSGIVYNANGVLTSTVGSCGGTGYVIGDLLTLSTTGTNGRVWVTGITGNGAVSSIELAAAGTNYTGVTQSAVSGGSGSALLVNITVGKSAVVTTAINHDFRGPSGSTAQDVVLIAGCATDTTFNNYFNIIGVDSSTTFSIAAPSGTASPTAANSNSTTLLVDATKNWAVNEHTGKLVILYGSGGAVPSSVTIRKITSNTANTITIPTFGVTPTNGTWRYIISEVHTFGTMQNIKATGKAAYGWTTSATATTLTDNTKNWIPNQWSACRLRIISGTGLGNEVTITSNTSNTLTVASWPIATPDNTSKYEILDTYGTVTNAGSAVTTITDTNKNWPINSLAGKNLKIVAGTGANQTTDYPISSNTATVITLASSVTTDTTTVYQIYEPPSTGAAAKIDWVYNISDATKKGKLFIANRAGGTNQTGFHYYDITTNTWDTGVFAPPMGQLMTTGSMFAYDGGDIYYFSVVGTNSAPIIYSLDLVKNTIDGAATAPYVHGSSIEGNRMEVVTTADGLKYIYLMRHSGSEFWRTLKFW